MKIGFPIWYGQWRGLQVLMSEISKSGFDYIEISLDYPWPFKGDLKIGEVVRLAESEGLSAAFHGPWRDIRLSSPIERIRSASVEAFKAFIEEISGFECDYLVVHLSTDQAVDRIPLIRDEVVESAVKSVEELSSFGRGLGLRIVFENVKEDLPEFREIISKTGSEICLDISHAVCASVRKGRKNDLEGNVLKWIKEFGDRIRVMHFSGMKFIGNRVKDHLMTDESDRFLQLVKRELKGLRVENFLLEIFEEIDQGEVSPRRLAKIVKYLRS